MKKRNAPTKGKKPKRKSKTAEPVQSPAPAAATTAPKPFKISLEAVAASRSKPARTGDIQAFDPAEAFAIAKPPPGVVPKGHGLAMDESINASIAWAGASILNTGFSQGYLFLGYAYLSELAQIPEYRLISDVISTEATRKWISIQSASEDEAKADKVKELDAELERLNARAIFKEISEHDGFFGRSHLYIDTGDTDDLEELKKPIGDGGRVTEKKFKKGFLKGLKTVEPVWCYPSRYNASDPLKGDWYNPAMWFVMGKEVHQSRLLTFVAREVPDLLKPAFSFGGLSLTQMAKPYVDNWLQTRQSVNDLIQAFSVMVLKTDMSTVLQGGGIEGLIARADIFNNIRNNRGLMLTDKTGEDFANVSAPLGTLDKLQAQAQEHICSVSRIPAVKYTGLTPTGLNASSEGELRCFDETNHAYQESFFRQHLTTIFKLAQINIWGAVDPDLTFIFKPLRELDEKELAELRKIEADTAAVYLENGVVSAEEDRQRLAGEPESQYQSLDVDDVPEPSAEEMEDLGKAAASFGKAGGEENGEDEPGGQAEAD